MPLSKKSTLPEIQKIIPRFYFPQYQPVIDVHSGLITGYESLMRCVDKHSQTVSASWLFQDELIHDWVQLEIDRSVRKQAIQRFSRDQLAGSLYLNISPKIISRSDLSVQSPTTEMISELGICPSRIVVEITEAGADLDLLKVLVGQYKAAGVRVAINDLGLPSSKIHMLAELQPDYFILKISDIRNHVRLGHRNQVLLALNLTNSSARTEIICEGVETEEDYFCALGFGAAQIKGWFFGGESIIFPKKTQFKSKVDELNKLHAEQRQIKMDRHLATRNLWSGWLKLIATHKVKNRIDDIKFSALVKLGIVRCFICDLKGNQIGGSVNFKPNGYFVDTDSVGVSRKGRPYFMMSLGLRKMKPGQNLVSNIYRDEKTEQACITLSMMLGRERILFMDVLVDEHSDGFYSVYSAAPNLRVAGE